MYTIDLTDVRINGKKTVIFCASVDHAAEIAKRLRDSGVKAEAVSGRDRVEVRERILKAVYAAVDEQAALDALETFAQDWSCIHAQLSIYFAERMPD